MRPNRLQTGMTSGKDNSRFKVLSHVKEIQQSLCIAFLLVESWLCEKKLSCSLIPVFALDCKRYNKYHKRK